MCRARRDRPLSLVPGAIPDDPELEPGHKSAGKDEWYLHQVLGTSNYTRRPGWWDWAHGWVNYQIEHHLCPNLTLLQLERSSGALEASCAAHGIPYVSGPLRRRFLKMFAVVTGAESMRWYRSIDEH